MDKVREEFEAWYAEQFKYSDKRLSRHGETYLSPFVGGLWSSWKASRAAICVELPDNLDGEYYADGWNACLIAVGEKIEESGVPYK